MSLRIQIEEKYKNALKSGNLDETNTLRLIKSAIKYKDIENRKFDPDAKIDDNQLFILLQSLIKQREDSIESFKNASRDDLIKKEQFEIGLINEFLPKQLNEQDIKQIIIGIGQKKSRVIFHRKRLLTQRLLMLKLLMSFQKIPLAKPYTLV